MAKSSGRAHRTVGLDLGDRQSRVCELDTASGQVVACYAVATSAAALAKRFAGRPSMRIALEIGTHSPWISRLLCEWGHEVLVANAHKLQLIFASQQKSDAVDAESLARVARLDPALLRPIRHRGAKAQADLAVLRARQAAVRCRTRLINHLRGAVKSFGGRLPASGAEAFASKAAPALPAPLRTALEPLLEVLLRLGETIRGYDQAIEALAVRHYPETARLRQVPGVGPLTALAYVLTLEEPGRFAKSRTVGPYLGLTPGSRSSGQSEPQRPITKQGDCMLRALLVQAAHYILGPFGKDCDLRRKGQQLATRGGKNAKKRAVVAVARKLAVLLHRLWASGRAYVPLRVVPLVPVATC
jgi:transposase